MAERVYRLRKDSPSSERNPIPSSIGRPIAVHEIYWIAGFLEGEGCFRGYQGRNGVQVRSGIEVTACQIQREPLERLVKLLGGKITVRTRNNRDQAIHDWRVRSNRARGVAYTVYSLMSPRRKAQIRRALGIESVEVAA